MCKVYADIFGVACGRGKVHSLACLARVHCVTSKECCDVIGMPFSHISALLLGTRMTSWHFSLQSAIRPVKNSTIGRPEMGRGSDVKLETAVKKMDLNR